MASPRATGRNQPSQLSDAAAIARYKAQAAQAAAELVEDGMRLGLGTGTTVAFLLPLLAERELEGLVCVATSRATEQAARELGIVVRGLDEVGAIDLAIDGADQIDPHGWLIKGGGAAHTRERIVAAAAARFVVIASAEKAVAQLSPPVPLELLRFGVHTTLRSLGQARLRARADGDAGTHAASERGLVISPDGGVIADYFGPIDEPRGLAARLSSTPGVVDHGLFAPELVSELLIAGPAGVERRRGARHEP